MERREKRKRAARVSRSAAEGTLGVGSEEETPEVAAERLGRGVGNRQRRGVGSISRRSRRFAARRRGATASPRSGRLRSRYEHEYKNDVARVFEDVAGRTSPPRRGDSDAHGEVSA